MRRVRPERAHLYRSTGLRDVQTRLASNVRRLRAERRWTQEEAAHRSEMATPLFQRIEAGATNTTLVTLARLCAGFGVEPDRLFKRCEELRPRPRGRPRRTL